MSLLRKKPTELTEQAAAQAAREADGGAPEEPVGKGRPTPRRRDAERRRGPVAPPPLTQREAYKRSKEAAGGRKLSKEERRTAMAQRRDRMMRGDDAYLLPRDKGEVRAYVRDLVDARRNLAGLLMPIAVLSFLTLAIPIPVVSNIGPLILMVMILAAVVDAYLFGRKVSRKVAQQFPKGDKSGQSTKGSALGFYAFNRATLIRKWRVPRPRVERGAIIE